jgi:hypothetical protein
MLHEQLESASSDLLRSLLSSLIDALISAASPTALMNISSAPGRR